MKSLASFELISDSCGHCMYTSISVNFNTEFVSNITIHTIHFVDQHYVEKLFKLSSITKCFFNIL